MRRFSCNHCCSGKVRIITYSESVFVALSILNAMDMRPIFRLCPAWVYNIFFFTLPPKRQDFRMRY